MTTLQMAPKESFGSKCDKAIAANESPDSNLPSAVVPFPQRGRRLDAADIAREYYGDKVGVEWVHENVKFRCRVSHRVILWWEYDVWAHLEAERVRALAGQIPVPPAPKVKTPTRRTGANHG